MGASLETVSYTGAAGADEAYAQLVEQARWEYGSDPYNGTIATSSGFFVASHDELTTTEAIELVHLLDEQGRLSKWGAWAAIALTGAQRSVIERKVSVADPDPTRIEQAVRAKVPAKYRYDGHVLDDVEVTYRATETRPSSRATKVWVVRHRHTEHRFATRGEAVAAARSMLDAAAASGPDRFWMHPTDELAVSVTPELAGPDGEAPSSMLVRRPRRLVATARIDVVARGSARGGWMFAGWAAT